MKLSNVSKKTEKNITNQGPFIKKWELMSWVREKTRLKEFDDLFKKLPKGLLLALRKGVAGNRAIISRVTEKKYEILAVGIEKRHPPHRVFPVSEIPPPLAYLIRNKANNVYIKNPLKNNLTFYMRELIQDEKITSIYYTMVTTLRGYYFIIVDTTGEKKELPEDERDFVDQIGQQIKDIEEARGRKEEEIKIITRVIEAKTIQQLIMLQAHVLQNPVSITGGLAKNVCRNVEKGASLKECQEKIEHILANSSAMEKRLKIFSAIANDIAKSRQLNESVCYISDFVCFLNQRFKKRVVYGKGRSPIICDQRKIEKFLERVIAKIREKHPEKVKLSSRIRGKTISIFISQNGRDLSFLERYKTLQNEENELQNQLDDLKLIASCLILRNIGIKIKFSKKNITLTIKR